MKTLEDARDNPLRSAGSDKQHRGETHGREAHDQPARKRDLAHAAARVWRDSGVTQKHGFELILTSATSPLARRRNHDEATARPGCSTGRTTSSAACTTRPTVYRARGDKRFVYLAQAQNDWDDRIVARQEIQTPKDLEGKKVIVTDHGAVCVRQPEALRWRSAAPISTPIEFVPVRSSRWRATLNRSAVELVARGEAVAAQRGHAPFDRARARSSACTSSRYPACR